jgi:hypothetical protein
MSGVVIFTPSMGGFLGAALTQGPIGAVLDARWTGAMVAGARVYPPGAYRAAFAVCGLFVVGSVLMTLLFRETGGRNVHDALRR